MRFQVTRALDAIESRMGTDPLLVGAVVDVAEAVRFPGPDGRPANLLRLGFVVDALSQHLVDESVALYAVGDRSVLSDTDLTANERMALRRWSDDGLIEIIPAGAPAMSRVCEIAWYLGLPVITDRKLPGFPGGTLVPAPAAGSLLFVEAGTVNPPQHAAGLSRLWRCPSPGCPSFSGQTRQPPPQALGQGLAVCPRHGERLTDVGQRPAEVALTLLVDGVVKHRFPLAAGGPVVVGRAPDAPGAVVLGPYLTQRVAPRVSRAHLRVELQGEVVVVTDISTNGSLRGIRADRNASPKMVGMVRGTAVPLGEWDVVELAEGVELCRAGRAPGGRTPAGTSSVMKDAPTVAINAPKRR